MQKIFFPILAMAAFFSSCIGDDIILDEVPEAVRILNQLDTIAVGESYQFDAMFTNNIGKEENKTVQWNSTDPTVLSIDNNGLATAISKGTSEISATVELEGKPSVKDQFTLVVDETTVVSNTLKFGELMSTSSYNLKGKFEIKEENGKLVITFSDNYQASTSLPGLYVYLGNNPSSISSALEIQKVAVFSGAHSYEVEGVGISDYQYLLYWCKPFNVKVGEGFF